MIIKRGLLQILLAAMLLAAQYGALTHAFRHMQDQQPPQSQQQDGGKQKSQSALCDFHVAFAQMFGGVSSSAPLLQVAANTSERSPHYLRSAFPSDLVVPASRGPPVLL